MTESHNIAIHPATADRWDDFVTLMGPKGGCGGCWCMLWRLSSRAFEQSKGAGNRAAIRALFDRAPAPGLIAYDGGAPVGWCALAPRTAYPRLATSRVLKPVDAAAVWSIACFLIRKDHRRQGLSVALLRAAGDFVRAQGGQILEGYPVEPGRSNYPPVYAWTGLAAAFRQAGFEEVLRRSETRPIMRKSLDHKGAAR